MEVTKRNIIESLQCTEVRFASFLSGGYIYVIVVNQLAKRTSVQWLEEQLSMFGLNNCPKIGRCAVS